VSFFLTVGITTICWLIVTFITPRTNNEVLKSFYFRVKPPGIWNFDLSIRKEKNKRIPKLLMSWFSGILFTYSTLFASGKLIFGEWLMGLIWGALAIVGFFILKFNLKRLF
jgi:hypothetical protein